MKGKENRRDNQRRRKLTREKDEGKRGKFKEKQEIIKMQDDSKK